MSLPKTYKPEPVFFHKKLKENPTPEEKLFYELEKWEIYKNYTTNGACRLELAKSRNTINNVLSENLDLFFALHDDEYHKRIAEFCAIEIKPLNSNTKWKKIQMKFHACKNVLPKLNSWYFNSNCKHKRNVKSLNHILCNL